MSTRNQEIDKAIKEHELSLLRLESAAEKTSSDMANMKEQLTSEMTSLQSQLGEIIKNLQKLNSEGSKSFEQYEEGEISKDEEETRLTRSNNRFSRIDFPKFDGSDVESWIQRCEHFFIIDETPERLKVRYASVVLKVAQCNGIITMSNPVVNLFRRYRGLNTCVLSLLDLIRMSSRMRWERLRL